MTFWKKTVDIPPPTFVSSRSLMGSACGRGQSSWDAIPPVWPLQTEQLRQAPDVWNLVEELHDLAMEGHNLSQSWYSTSEEKLKKIKTKNKKSPQTPHSQAGSHEHIYSSRGHLIVFGSSPYQLQGALAPTGLQAAKLTPSSGNSCDIIVALKKKKNGLHLWEAAGHKGSLAEKWHSRASLLLNGQAEVKKERLVSAPRKL